MMYRGSCCQHQVAAVVVAMTEHARLGGQFLDDRRALGAQGLALRRAEDHAAIGLEKMLEKKSSSQVSFSTSKAMPYGRYPG